LLHFTPGVLKLVFTL